MLKISNQLLVLLIIFATAIAQDDIGYLSVDVDENYVIYIDTLILSNHSFSNLAVEPGEYQIRAFIPGNLNWQHTPFEKLIQVRAKEQIAINFKYNNFYKIYSNPINSKVYLNDIFLGNTPLILNKDLYDDIELSLHKSGFKKETLLLSNAQNEYFINFTDTDQRQERTVFKTGIENKSLRWVEEGLILTSLITSWTSFFFKREADKSYIKYQNTASPQQMDKYFNRAENFDRYAEIAIGVSIVSLGTYLYLLLTD